MNRNSRLIRLSVTCAALAGFVVATGAVFVPAPFISMPALAVEGIRAPTDECFWSNFDWGEMQAAEQNAWSKLGWTEEMWESDDESDVPASDSKSWAELNQDERAALADLGVTEEMWGSTADC